jgi:DNA-binding beta-propeller fold protein YncE
MIFNKPVKKKASHTKRNSCGAWFFIFICLALVAPLELYCQEIQHVRVKHVLDIRGDFNQPTDIAVGKKGRIYVLDGANNQVKIFNQNGKFIQSFGNSGTRDGEFDSPVGIDVDAHENVYVADTGNRRIQVFDRNGGYLRKIDLSPWSARPVEVEVQEGSSLVYVSDADNHRILCFQKDGTFNFAWGDLGERLGELRFPGMTATDSRGDVYVVDILNGRVQKFSPHGKNPRQIGELGVLPGQLFRPKGIAIDDRSRVYVSDSYTGLIQVFDKDSKFRGILSTKDALLRLTTPLGLAVDANRRLFVVQSALNKVSVFILLDK